MKLKKMTKTMMWILMTALVFVSASVPSVVYASENVPVTVEIPITYIVHGNDKTAGGDIFVLTADEPETPMPEGSENGKLAIDISREGTYSFGEITYERPNVWWYTISRETTKKKGVTKDDSVYRAKVIALNDGHGYVLVYKDGSEKKHELVYEDRVSPDTGDTSRLLFYGMGCAASAAALLLAVIRRRNRRE